MPSANHPGTFPSPNPDWFLQRRFGWSSHTLPLARLACSNPGGGAFVGRSRPTPLSSRGGSVSYTSRKAYMPPRFAAASAGGSGLLGRFEQLDGVAIGVFQLDLLAAGTHL